MSKIITGYFYVSTGYTGCTKRSNFKIEFNDDDPDFVIDTTIQDQFNDFVAGLDMGWIITDTQNEE